MPQADTRSSSRSSVLVEYYIGLSARESNCESEGGGGLGLNSGGEPRDPPVAPAFSFISSNSRPRKKPAHSILKVNLNPVLGVEACLASYMHLATCGTRKLSHSNTRPAKSPTYP